MKQWIFAVVLAVSSSAFGACFEFEGRGPMDVGPVQLAAEATRVCVIRTNAFAHTYYSVRFADSQGDLAQLASQTEILGRCPGFCRTYVLTSGNSNGQNVNPDRTRVQFQVESSRGSVSIDGRTYHVRKTR